MDVRLLIGGGGEQVTLKLVARYGDVCNLISDPTELKRKFAVLKQHCQAARRDYESIHRTALTHCIIAETDEQARTQIPGWAGAVFPGDVGSYGLVGTVQTIRERLAAYEAAGVQELVITLPDATHLHTVHQFARTFIG